MRRVDGNGRVRWGAVVLLLLLSNVCFMAKAGAAGEGATSSQVKMAFLYQFTRFITWPEEVWQKREDPLHLCVLGRDPFGAELKVLEKKQTRGHPLRVRHIVRYDPSLGCQVLFIAGSEKGRWSHLFKQLSGHPVLTVADTAGFIQAGGMINLFNQGRRVRFEIDPDTIRGGQLQISSRVLRLARIR